MPTTDALKKKREKLKREISGDLEILAGSLGKSPAMAGYSLTTKKEGKTVTLYVRKDLAPKVQAMTERHKKVKALLLELCQVNWDLLRMENE
jgi:hypothetical protein